MQHPPTGSASELSFDPHAMLERDSRVLLDPVFLSTLHAELGRELDPQEARVSLLQMGFLHGLQDVTRALAATAAARADGPSRPLLSPLRMPYSCRIADGPSGELVLVGRWPDGHEAAAHVEALGESPNPACALSAGYSSGWLSGAFDADLLALETGCVAASGRVCHFVAREAASWRASGDPAAIQALAALPFAVLRGLVRERFAHGALDVGEYGAFDDTSAAVHVWGPVMVLPFGGPDEALEAVSLLGRDPSTADVSVLVVDLAGAIVDEAFGALALEQLVQTAESWGLETLFVDPSPLSVEVLERLDNPPLLVLKDLEPAIALAFQIARSQRVVV